ncbi:hypothetical protein ACO0LF_18150 [Undibacterium sp. Di27W]|uniref:hypothetical protein n=1 Tax=Undibacterium sp. Di27W TaxID=3413036 RepID=UPI003BF3235D
MQAAKTGNQFFWLSAICASVFSLLLGLMGFYFIPFFYELHQSFNLQQDFIITKFVDDYGRYLWRAGLPCLAIWLNWLRERSKPQAKARASQAFAVLAAVQLLAMVIVIWAMYAPITHM